ncbi:hypothetical protein SLEP1_g58319 [Rubroshorea leprosula]|uniref:Uncharacterized protein n=1 Tax=Rubroshorea leprosula TaxID=152421 RepID=A0AAV5MQG3_9ROSI|nr:hypothetical protein SLEP1_g58319 [Rubroshorea leprosula]
MRNGPSRSVFGSESAFASSKEAESGFFKSNDSSVSEHAAQTQKRQEVSYATASCQSFEFEFYGLDSDRLVLSGRRGDELDYALGLLSFMPPLALGDSFPSLSVSPVFRVVVEGVLCILFNFTRNSFLAHLLNSASLEQQSKGSVKCQVLAPRMTRNQCGQVSLSLVVPYEEVLPKKDYSTSAGIGHYSFMWIENLCLLY